MLLFKRFYVLGVLSSMDEKIIGYYRHRSSPINNIPYPELTQNIKQAIKYPTEKQAKDGIERIENEVVADKLSVIHVPGMVTVKMLPPNRHGGIYDFLEYHTD